MQTGENSIIEARIFLNLAPFKTLTNCKDFPRSLNEQSGRASHLVYK